MLVESLEAFVPGTIFAALPVGVCSKIAGLGVFDECVVSPGHDYGRLHILGSKLAVIPSRFGCAAAAFEFLNDIGFPETTVTWVFNVPRFVVCHTVIYNCDHPMQDFVGHQDSCSFPRRASLIWFHDVFRIAEWSWSAVVASGSAQSATWHPKPDSDAVFVAYEVFDQVVSVLVQYVATSTSIAVEGVDNVTFCFYASCQASSASEDFYEEIRIYPSGVPRGSFALSGLVRFWFLASSVG
jgi:hypothetical protein